MKAKITVGLQWGDEGKGTVTDYLCSHCHPDETVVVRFSGGQQAGHTVMRDDVKHVFATYGSGTLQNIPTYISEYCTFHPTFAMNEYDVLVTKGFKPHLMIHPLAKLTIPCDIEYNKIREGANKHGSCGMGVGATMKRHVESPIKIFAVDMLNPELLRVKMIGCLDYYIDKLRELSLHLSIPSFVAKCGTELKEFMEAVKSLNYSICSYNVLDDRYENIIFEGSQGIMLDMDHGTFPNVTYGHTTSRNAIEICDILGIDERNTDIYYVTRCYQTRHGNGWMSQEQTMQLVNNEEETNQYNQWQGSFRVGELDYKLLKYALECDDAYSYDCRKNIVITCLDQRPDFNFDVRNLSCRFANCFESHSPYSRDIKKLGHLVYI